MLPVYQAKSFVRIIEKGGRTKPWVIIVDTREGTKQFVVKVFTTDLIERRNSVCNEVLGSVLAKEFDLKTPSPALIEFDSDFAISLNSRPSEILETIDDRIKFGCELISGTLPYDDKTPTHVLNKYMELDTLFAFDSLIRNRDRGTSKPNLFFANEQTYLIDHEMAFERLDIGLKEIGNNDFNIKWMAYHLCRQRLSSAYSPVKQKYFETFEEYLRNLNVNVIDAYIKQLRHYGHPCANEGEIKQWLNLVKQKAPIFINYLKQSIT